MGKLIGTPTLFTLWEHSESAKCYRLVITLNNVSTSELKVQKKHQCCIEIREARISYRQMILWSCLCWKWAEMQRINLCDKHWIRLSSRPKRKRTKAASPNTIKRGRANPR